MINDRGNETIHGFPVVYSGDPPPRRKLEIVWTCGVPGCKHATPEGAQAHCEMLNDGMPPEAICYGQGTRDQ